MAIFANCFNFHFAYINYFVYLSFKHESIWRPYFVPLELN